MRLRQPTTRAQPLQKSTQTHCSKHKAQIRGVCCIKVAIFVCLLAASAANNIYAVPTDSNNNSSSSSSSAGAIQLPVLQRAARDATTTVLLPTAAASFVQDTTTKDALRAPTTESALDQPQGQCLLDGVLVSETSVVCEKQVGCRGIQKTGHCCPDYKCDCEKNGKTYSNGDKLVDPVTPCTVCYCQGGEILCSSVTCFQRDDCTPKYIPGRCCPEYDNCPVLNNGPNATTTKPLPGTAVAGAAKTELPAAALNSKITIKEITKPTEIRITDDNKAVPIHQMLKPSTTTSATTQASTSSAAGSVVAATSNTPTPSSPPPLTSAEDATAAGALTAMGNDESTEKAAAAVVAAAATHVSLDNNHKALPTVAGGIYNESLKLSASVAYSTDSKRTTSAPIPNPVNQTLYDISGEDFEVGNTQGLAREALNDPSKVNIKRENLVTTETVLGLGAASAEDNLDSTELLYAHAVPVQETRGSEHLQQASAELEPDTAGSDNIYQIILTTDGPRTSTESFLAFKEHSTTEGIEPNWTADVLNKTGDKELHSLERTTDVPMKANGSKTESQADESTTEQSPKYTTTLTPLAATDNNKSTTEGAHHFEDEDTAIPMESNPAYPSLPEDDFSLRDPLSETDDVAEPDIKDEPRSISTAFVDVAKHTNISEDNSNSSLEGSGGDMPSNLELASTTEVAAAEKLAKVALMYSSEETSAETAIVNTTDFQEVSNLKQSENESGSGAGNIETETIDALLGTDVGGSGSDESMSMPTIEVKAIRKQREPTTARPTRKSDNDVDIDELGASGDGKAELGEDPKLDAESLKADESQEAGIVKYDSASKGNVLTLKTNAALDRAAEELENANEGIGRVQRLVLQRVS